MIKLRKQAARKVGHPDAEGKVIMEMSSYFADSAIEVLYFDPALIEAITNWVDASRATKPVVEVGGFILGKYAQPPNQGYEVELSLFIPAQDVAFSDSHYLDFGEGVLDAVDQALLANKDLALIGWFHTHPGHGLFLSNTDMRTQDGFFRKAYQFAIVLDSLSENYDFAVFSRQLKGPTNQKQDLLAIASWQSLYQQTQTDSQNSADHA